MSSNFGQQQFQRQQFKHKPADLAKPVDHDSVRKGLRIPARGLLVTGVISVILALTCMVGGILHCAVNKVEIQRYWVIQLFNEEIKLKSTGKGDSKKLIELKERRDSQAQTAFTLVLGAITIGCLTLASIYMFYISCGVMMMQLRNYRMCKIACILAMIPVLSPLLFVGIPFGIIGFRKLSKRDAKKAFV